MVDRNTFWFFGCSMTSGHGLNWEWLGKNYLKDKLNHPLWKQIGDGYEDFIFPKLLAKHFDMEYKNYAVSGQSNQTILVQLSNCLHLMKKGDKVWVNSTWPMRFPIPHPDGEWLVETMVPMWMNDDGSLEFKEGLIPDIWGEDNNEIIKLFITQIVGPNSEALRTTYKTALYDITLHLNNIGIKSHLWDATERAHHYEGIKHWKKGIEDAHPSPNGHENIFKDVVQKFE